tara:strand:- start:2367 stop:2672 length:306 start_codon:yes stop_codon:yes gene_type:complete
MTLKLVRREPTEDQITAGDSVWDNTAEVDDRGVVALISTAVYDAAPSDFTDLVRAVVKAADIMERTDLTSDHELEMADLRIRDSICDLRAHPWYDEFMGEG